MRSITRIAQPLASIAALALIGAASNVAAPPAAGPTTITISPSPATAGQAVTITLAGQGCISGGISFGDGSQDEPFGYGAGGSTTVTHYYGGAGTYAIHTYFDAASVAGLVGAERTAMTKKGANCVGGPVTLHVRKSITSAPAATGTAVAAMPQPRCPANLTLVGDGKTMPYRCQMDKPACPAGMVWFEEGNVVGCGQPLKERPVNPPE